MAYRVEYGPIAPAKKHSRVRILTILCFLIFCLMTGMLWPEGRRAAERLLFPGDLTVTVGALEEMTRQLRSGEPLPEALADFCVRVSEGRAGDPDPQ